MTGHFGYDVAIVGASIAGCTAATLFGRHGAEVALIERNSDPAAYKKICTHFIQPSAVPTIERLGLASAIEEAGGIRNGADVWTRWGWIRWPRDGDEKAALYGYNIRREKLDPMLRSVAAQTPGVNLIAGQTARRLLSSQGRITGVGLEDRSGSTREFRARLVIAADGRDSDVARLAGVPGKVRPHNRFAYFAYFRDLPLAAGTISQLWFLEPDVAYAFPNDDGLTLVLCFPHKDKLEAFKSDLEQSFVSFIEGLPDAPPIRRASRVSEILGKVEMPNISRPAAQAGLAFIGDAAMASDPVHGIGCGFAFQSAEMLVDCTADTLAEDGDLDRALARYRKRHRAAFAGHHLLTSSYSTGRNFNPLERLLISAAARDPRMGRHLHEFQSRDISVRQFLSPLAISRALWVNAVSGKNSKERLGARREALGDYRERGGSA